MQGKTVVMTGATSGIGGAGALELARQGARLVLIARDPARGAQTLAAVRAANPAVGPTVHYADLSLIADMKRVSAEIAAAEPTIDVLVNNAGATFEKREVTADGLEKTFAVNHMAYFVVTLGLLDRLKATPGSRVVSTSSGAQQIGRIGFDDLQSARKYSGFGVYCMSKLCNVLFTRELARRLEGTGTTANCFHPGFVASRFGDNNGGLMGTVFGLAKRFAIPPEKGADTLVYLASSPEVAGRTGGYYVRRVLTQPSAAARDAAAAARLWTDSERLAGL